MWTTICPQHTQARSRQTSASETRAKPEDLDGLKTNPATDFGAAGRRIARLEVDSTTCLQGLLDNVDLVVGGPACMQERLQRTNCSVSITADRHGLTQPGTACSSCHGTNGTRPFQIASREEGERRKRCVYFA